MRRFLIGDIHGEYDKFVNCLNHVGFDFNNDQLIQLGDVVDRGPKSFECVELLLNIKNLIAIRGNHDMCWYQSIVTGNQNVLYNQGGRQTYESYYNNCNEDVERNIPFTHVQFFKNQLDYYIDNENNCFVHGGFDPNNSIAHEEDPNILYWDRHLWQLAMKLQQQGKSLPMVDTFKMIYIGHSPTTYYGSKIPLKACNMINIDTGCGKGGLLTIYNLETGEYYQC